MRKRILIWSMIALLILSFTTGCASANKSAKSNDGVWKGDFDTAAPQDNVSYPEEEAGYYEDDAAENSNDGSSAGGLPIGDIPQTDHKIIHTAEITLETLEFDETVERIVNRVNAIGGYAEVSNIQGKRFNYQKQSQMRKASFTFRIPKKQFSQFKTDVKEYGNVVSEDSRGENITDRYFDTEARVKSLEIREERILAILQEATKLQDILELERELSNIRYDIEKMTGTLRKWDNLVEYSTIYVYVNEVEELKPVEQPKPKNLWERITVSFKQSLEALKNVTEGLILFVVVIAPFAVVIGLIVAVAYIIYRKTRRQ